MSDIRFNRWLHQSGTGGVFQDSSGRVGIGSSTPTDALDIVGVASATSFFGPLTGNVTGDVTSSGTSTFDVISGVSTIGVTTVHLTGINNLSYPTAGPLSNRNIVINGAMQHSQRDTSFTHTTSPQYTLDRFEASNGSSFNWNSAVITQSSDSPDGFASSLKVDVNTTNTPTGGQNALFKYKIEAQDLQQLSFGTSAAKSFTLSFWVKSNKTGTYTIQIRHSDADKYLLSEYSISSSSTWEHKTLTFVGNTADVIDNNNGIGFEVRFNLACGPDDHTTAKATWTAGGGGTIHATSNQVNLFDNTSNEWYLTGVQLESGSVATPFEHRSYGDELARCQRYCYAAVADGSIDNYAPLANGRYYSATNAQFNIFFPVTMRHPPTLDSNTTAVGTFFYNTGGGFGGVEATEVTLNERSYNNATVTTSGATGQTAGDGTTLYSHDAEVAKLIFTAEL